MPGSGPRGAGRGARDWSGDGVEMNSGPATSPHTREEVGPEGGIVIILGVVLLLIGYLANIGILVTIGIILVIVGALLWILGSMGRPLGGRRHYW
jgi:hypothetical protein